LIVFIIYRVYGKQKIVSLLNQLSTTPWIIVGCRSAAQ
jgi:hypothetical protein